MSAHLPDVEINDVGTGLSLEQRAYFCHQGLVSMAIQQDVAGLAQQPHRPAADHQAANDAHQGI